jgi:hypothetical protein
MYSMQLDTVAMHPPVRSGSRTSLAVITGNSTRFIHLLTLSQTQAKAGELG